MPRGRRRFMTVPQTSCPNVVYRFSDVLTIPLGAYPSSRGLQNIRTDHDQL